MENVESISEKCHVGRETVRRWIKTGKLKAAKSCNKNGYFIKESDYKDFLKNNPKYCVERNKKINLSSPIIIADYLDKADIKEFKKTLKLMMMFIGKLDKELSK